MTHRIVIKIGPGGKVSSEVQGIPGPSCGAVSAWLDALGKVAHVEDTPEAHEHVSETEQDHEKLTSW